MILFDTNVFVHFLKGLQPLSARVAAADRGQIAVASIVLFELEFGTLAATGMRRRTTLSAALAGVTEVPFDTEAALEAARIRYDLKRRGLAIGVLDAMIAGTAVSRGATLVTNNTKEFSRVKGLRLEDWTL